MGNRIGSPLLHIYVEEGIQFYCPPYRLAYSTYSELIETAFLISYLNKINPCRSAQLESRATTPIPFWLKTEDEEIIPELKLPKTSDDLLIDPDLAFKACGVYEILRHYYLILRLSLFRFEDFCAALASEEQSNLLSEVHIALLKAIVRAEEKDNTNFGPMDHKDSINALFYFVDSITWPEALRQYLRSDTVANAEPLSILGKGSNIFLHSKWTLLKSCCFAR